jgi:K(+)-stimulated pyrophosphate-energized sodium pump
MPADQQATIQIQLLVWIFVMRLLMVVTSGLSYFISEAIARGRYAAARTMNFEAPLTALVWIASITSISPRTSPVRPDRRHQRQPRPVVEARDDHHLRHAAAGAIIPEVTKIFTSVHSRHVARSSHQQGGRRVAQRAAAAWSRATSRRSGSGAVTIGGLMAIAVRHLARRRRRDRAARRSCSRRPPADLRVRPRGVRLPRAWARSRSPVRQLRPRHRQRQSVYELSLIEEVPGIREELRRDSTATPTSSDAKQLLEENDGAGNTFKPPPSRCLSARPSSARRTLIFSIIMLLTDSLANQESIADCPSCTRRSCSA